MVSEIKKEKLSKRLKGIIRTRYFLPFALLILAVISIPVIKLLTSKPVEIRQRAATLGLTATIKITPSTGSIAPNQQFTADLVIDGGGQAFNAAQATVSVANNLSILSVDITPVSRGGCNFTFANQSETPSASNLSFAGAILNGSSSRCTLYTVTLQAGASGSGSIGISNGHVASYEDNTEIFLSSQNGTFNISTGTIPPIPQSVLYLSPYQSNVSAGQAFSVQVRIDTSGQLVNAIESQISYPAVLLDVTSIDATGNDFGVTAVETFANGIIHIAYGSITPKSGDLLVTTIRFTAKASGIANVNFLASTVVSSVSNTAVLKNTINGSYNITGSLSPTVTAPPTSTPIVTTQPTSTPIVTSRPTVTPTTIPSPTPTSTPTPTPTRTPTPTPINPSATIAPTATPTPVPNVSVTVDVVPGETYQSSYILTGSKSTNVTAIFINNSSSGITFPTASQWRSTVNLNLGNNPFSIYAQDAVGNRSNTVPVSISRHRIGDITGDNIIDLTDLSIFGSDWQKTGNLNNALSDMNNDTTVNLTDFSIIAKVYGN